jgi:branched-chain amino acid transport system substrate-binding protein
MGRSRSTAVAVVALAAALGGCGGSGAQQGGFTYENTLTVYSDLPLQGPQGALMTSINDGEILALSQAHARGEDRNVSIALLDDAQAAAGGWTVQTTGDAARAAGQDLDAIAYIGDFDSAATAVSLPITNENNILQVSPASPYIGLTDASAFAPSSEPDSFYPDGHKTFARLIPSNLDEAAATVTFMRDLGVHSVYTLEGTAPAGDPYDSVIAPIVARDARGGGIRLAGSAPLDSAHASSFAALISAIAASRADAVFVGAAPGAGSEALWTALHAKLPAVKLFAPSTLATGRFLSAIAPVAATTYVTIPILPLAQYPASARSVLAAYRRTFASAPTAYSLYGYEAMASVLAAIARAGKNAGNRLDVVHDYFALGERDSVIGSYRIDGHGDTSLSRLAAYRVGPGGSLVELRRLSG